MTTRIENIYLQVITLIDELAAIHNEDALTALESIKLKLLISLVKLKENKSFASHLMGILFQEEL